MSEVAGESPFSLHYIFEASRRNLRYIIIVVGVSALLAIFFTLPFIYPPEFKAEATIFPTSAERFDVVNLFHEEPLTYLYGTSKEVEKLENIANSDEVSFFVIDSLDLWDVYGYDPESDASPRFYAKRTYRANVQAIKVSGNGLMIQAYDIDPERSAAIVNLVIDKMDQVYRAMLNRNKLPIYEMYQGGYRNLAREMVRLTDSTRKVRTRYNILNTDYQTQQMVKTIMAAQGELAAEQARYNHISQDGSASESDKKEARARVSERRSQVNALVNSNSGSPINLEDFREGFDQIEALEEMIATSAMHMKQLREKIDLMEMMNKTDYSTIVVPSRAEPSDRKARPVRWVILLLTVLLATLVSVMGAVLAERLTTRKAD